MYNKRLKKIVAFLLVIIMVMINLPVIERQVEASASDVIEIPDANFKAYLNEYLGRISNADITKANLEEIRMIQIYKANNITDITGIEYCTNLHTLELYGDSDIDISMIKNLPELKTLRLRIKGIDMSDITSCSKLKELSIGGKYLDESIDLSEIEKLSGLETLLLDGVKCDDYSYIVKLKKLGTLKIFSTDMEILPQVNQLPNLGILNVVNCTNLTNISGLQGCQKLYYLSLNECTELSDITPIINMHSLEHLDIEHVNIEEGYESGYLYTLSSLANLENLKISRCGIRDEHTYVLNNLTNLKELIICCNEITNTSFLLKHINNLQSLSLANNKISTTKDIEKLVNLVKLEVSGTYINNYQFIKKLPKLTERTIRHSSWSEDWPSYSKSEYYFEISTNVEKYRFKNEVKDENGNYVVPNKKDFFEYDYNTNEIVLNLAKCGSAVNLEYDFSVQTNNGTELFVNHIAKIKIFIYQELEIINHTGDILVDEGKDAYLRVYAKGYGDLKYQWYKDGEMIPNSDREVLPIHDIQKNQEGTYKVTVTDNKKSLTSKNIYVRVYEVEEEEKVLRITRQLEDMTVREGKDIRLEIEAEGVGTLRYQWYKDGETIIGATDSYINMTTIPQFSGLYSVLVYDDVSYLMSYEMLLTVTPIPISFISYSEKNIKARVGEKIYMGASAAGARFVEYQWYKDGMPLEGETEEDLIIDSAKKSDAGVYFLEAKDEYTSTRSDEFIVSVENTSIQIENWNTLIESEEGEDVAIECLASGSDIIKYKWFFNGSAITDSVTSNKLFIQDIDKSYAGTYEVDIYYDDSVYHLQTQIKVYKKIISRIAVDYTEDFVGNAYTLKAYATGGAGNFQFKYGIKNLDGSIKVLSDYSTSPYCVGIYESAGIKEFVLYVKDSRGTEVTSTVKVDVIERLSGSLKVNSDVAVVGDRYELQAIAKGGRGNYLYSYNVRYADGRLEMLQDYSSNAKFIGIYKSLGVKEFVVYVKDREGTIVSTNTVKVNVTEKLSGSLKVNSNSALVGEKFELQATAKGGSGSYLYKYEVHNEDGSIFVLKDYSTNSKFTGTYQSSGVKEFIVYVKDCGGRVATTNNVKVNVNERLGGILTVDGSTKELTKDKGSKITLTAMASGGSGSYTYKFAVLNVATGKWTVLKDFSTSNTCTYTLNYSGKKEFAVTIKDSKGHAGSVNRITVNVIEKLSGKLTVGGSTAALSKEKGSKITLTAVAAGGSGSYTYKYAVLNVETGKWSVLKDFSTAKTYTYALNYPGKKEFAVTVKDSKGATVATNRIVVNVTEKLSGKLTVGGSTAALKKEKGSKITLTAVAAGGSGSYTYKYAVLNAETGKWSVLKDFSTAKTYTYALNYPGKKEFAVTIKDSKGATVATNRIVVNVTEKLSGKLTVNGSTAALTKEKGSKITLTPVANGGSGSYTYKYAVLNVETGKWSVLKDFSTAKTYTYALNYPGKKEFAVTVKDSKGATVATNRITVVVK